jgi:hypothetical protein
MKNKLRKFFNAIFVRKKKNVRFIKVKVKEFEWDGKCKSLKDRHQFVRDVFYSYHFTYSRADFCEALDEALQIITHMEMKLLDALVELKKIKEDKNAK